MTIDELKALRLANQHITAKTNRLKAARDLCGFQSQFLSNAVHSIRLRSSDFTLETVGDAMVKNWTVRGTVHVFAEEDLPLFKYHRDNQPHLSEDWRGYVHHITREWTLTPERQRELSRAVIDALEDRPLSREELKDICRARNMTAEEEEGMFQPWGGGMRDLCERGFLCYAVCEKKVFAAAPDFEPMDEREALGEQARRYFTHFAPATLRDAAYYFGMPQTKVRAIMENLPVKSLECEGKTYFYIENGRTDIADVPGCVFLAGFDQLMLGYRKEDNPFLPGEYLRRIYNLAGIVMPALLLRGEVAGRWKYKGGKLICEMFREIVEVDRKIIADAAETLWGGIKKIEWK